MFLGKDVLGICSQFTVEHPCRSAISNKVALQLYWSRTSACVFSCKFAAYFQNIFLEEHLWKTVSGFTKVNSSTSRTGNVWLWRKCDLCLNPLSIYITFVLTISLLAVNPFSSHCPLLIFPLKTSENLGFLMFSGESKGNIGKKRVNQIAYNYLDLTFSCLMFKCLQS